MTRRRFQSLVASLVLFVVTTALTPLVAGAEVHTGQRLGDALLELNTRAANILFSTRLVDSSMRVKAPPTAGDPLTIAREILAPYNLTLVAGPENRWIVMLVEKDQTASAFTITGRVFAEDTGNPVQGAKISSGETVVTTDASGGFSLQVLASGEVEVLAFDYSPASFVVTSDASSDLTFRLKKKALEELTVVSSQYVLFGENQASQLTNDEIDRLPHLADDVMRAVQRLPAVASDELSARINLRGGTRDEIAVRLDGMDLIDPFHLKDLTGIFSIIDSNLIDTASVLPGGFPIKYRDQSSGFVNIDSLPPPEQNEHSIGISFVNSFINSRGSINDQRGGWLLSVRRGYLDLLVDDRESEVFSPRYLDAFVKIEHEIGDRHIGSLQFLGAWEDLEIRDFDGAIAVEDVRVAGKSDTTFVWGRVRSNWSDRLRSDNVLWHSDVDRVRDTDLFAPSDTTSTVLDDRKTKVRGLRSDWQWSWTDTWGVSFGVEFKEHDVDYDYSLTSTTNPALFPAQEPIDRRTTIGVTGTSHGGYVAVSRTVGKLDAELGWRWDAEGYTGRDESFGSPRLAVQYRINDRTRLSGSWGDYNQFQRAESLHVEDGVESFYPSAQTEHRVIGLEHQLSKSLLLKAEAYQKRYDRVLPYYTNLFDPLEVTPEANPDRILVDAASAEAHGIELTMRYRTDDPFSWWATYAYSRVEDEVNGRDIARDWDQRHAVNLIGSWVGEKWKFNAAAVWRSGWPRTDILLGNVDTPSGPQSGVVPGERNASNYDDYSRVDVRVSRDVALKRGVFTYYFEVYNVFNTENICCVDTINIRPGPELSLDEEDWGGTLPSFGFVWRFH